MRICDAPPRRLLPAASNRQEGTVGGFASVLDECKTSRKGVRGMNLSRRGFFKATGAALATTMAFELSSQTQAFASESKQDWKLVNTEEYTNICCYCAGGCGSLLSVRDGELVNLEGDPDHPINEGGLCPKGATMFQLRTWSTPRRAKSSRTRSVRRARWCAVPAQATGRTSPRMTPSPRSPARSRTRAMQRLSRRTTMA